MHSPLSSLVVCLLLCLAFVLVSSAQQDDAGLVRHIVTFRFKTSVSDQERAEVMSTYRALQFKCVNRTTHKPYIVSFDAGFPNSKEGQDQGQEQGYIVTFKNVEDRNYFVGRPYTYPYDPYHDAFKTYVGPLLNTTHGTGVFVFDFTVLPPVDLI
eukprot:TRINITY_DN3051_c0_g2_i1.p1 TRINITY_DN3051_c0_g2~~TRINITY_DN3051_c0_g2_i1.p1  ORF type:complete len:170 (-),score=27.26 TRINITY_DN3051_c0_g2_i1:117-581(-)